MPKLLIEVTQKDIETAEPGGFSCPVSRAIGRLGYDRVYTGRDRATYDGFGPRAWFDLPASAVKFVANYDAWKSGVTDIAPDPVTFEIDA